MELFSPSKEEASPTDGEACVTQLLIKGWSTARINIQLPVITDVCEIRVHCCLTGNRATS